MVETMASFDSFLELDIRIGTVLSAERAQTRKSTYRMRIDFGEEIGIKLSCGAYTNYAPETLVGRQVVGIVNFAPRRMGVEVSEVLVLGVEAPGGEGTIFLTAEQSVANGAKIF